MHQVELATHDRPQVLLLEVAGQHPHPRVDAACLDDGLGCRSHRVIAVDRVDHPRGAHTLGEQFDHAARTAADVSDGGSRGDVEPPQDLSQLRELELLATRHVARDRRPVDRVRVVVHAAPRVVRKE